MKALYCPYCCGGLTVNLRTEGPPYLSYEVADEIECDNTDCGARWNPNGLPVSPPWRFA